MIDLKSLITNLKSKIINTKYAPVAFRLSIFVLLAAILVLIFPRYNNAFRYHFEIGKPWGYSTLTADFDFPIYKSDDQLATEQQQRLSSFTPYFKYIPRVQKEVKVVSLQTMEWLQSEGFTTVDIQQRKFPVSDLYTPMTAHKQFGYDWWSLAATTIFACISGLLQS